jgi:hypothetical protein
MRIAELFAGSRSIGKVCDAINDECVQRGEVPRFEVWSVDVRPFAGIDLVADLLSVKASDAPWAPDFTWASPPCTSYSICGIRYHRKGGEASSEEARLGDQLVQHTLQLVETWGGGWIMENPRGMLRKMPWMKRLDRRSVTYCSYGDHVMKPTDVWSNMFYSAFLPEGWDPRPMCHNNRAACHHDRQPRSYEKRKAMGVAQLGITGRSSAYDRSKLPEALCREVIAKAHQMWLLQVGPFTQHR